MTSKQIEASRELRLWIGQVIVPAALIISSVPELRENAKRRFADTKEKIEYKMAKFRNSKKRSS